MAGNWIKNYMNGNQYIKGNTILSISKDISRDQWVVRIYNVITGKDVFKYFKSRSQALVYYKLYMKKN